MNTQSQPPGIAEISDPVPADFRRSIVTQVHYAREMLSLAERAGDCVEPLTKSALTHPRSAVMQIRSALKALSSARDLLHESDPGSSHARMDVLLERCVCATRAAEGHIKRYRAYAKSADTKLEQDQLKKLRPIWKRSAEEAKKDTHRALLFICERFPDAFEREEIA